MRPEQKASGNRSYSFFVLTWLIGMFLILLVTIPAKSQNTQGEQIFDRMVHVYAKANTYQDSGRVQTDSYELGQEKPEFTTIKNFATTYNRATQQFCFWYEKQNESFFDIPDKMVIWSQKDTTQRWWTIYASLIREESLSDALATATGVSGSSSRKIPGLLLAEPIGAGWGIDSLKNVKLIGTDSQNNRPCYRLVGVHGKNRMAYLWIDQQSFLLLRIDEEYSTGKDKLKTSLTYQPSLTKSIAKGALTFEPPHFFWLWTRPTLKYCLYALVGLIWFYYGRPRRRKEDLVKTKS